MSEAIDLMDFPTNLATQLGIPTFAGQILASIIFCAMLILPTLFLSKNFKIPAALAVLFMGLFGASFCVALGWLPIWLFTIVCLSIALIYAKQIIGLFKG